MLYSQSWEENIRDPRNFYSIRSAYLQKLNSEKSTSDVLKMAEEDGEESKFRRWEYIMEPRVYPSGIIPPSTILLDELNKFNENNKYLFDTIAKPAWRSLEPVNGFPENGFSGRLNCICFHPTDTNTMFVGAPAGGLWKTNDGGQTWFPLSDRLPSLGVSEIVINYENPDIMYMATGDKDAANFISNPYSYGLLKSTDGGYSWQTTGLTHSNADQTTIQRLLIHPKNPHILLAAVTGVNGAMRGIWRTSDDGATWKNVSGGAKYDLEFNPGNPDIMYTSGWKYLARSTDAGITWTNISSPNLPSSDVTSAKIAVSPANPHLVAAQFLNPNTGYTYGLYKSYDDGVTWNKINSYEISTQAAYDWVLTLSPSDTGIVLYGGQYLFGSDNGGQNKFNLPSGHVDHHGLDYRPGSDVLYSCNDGGLNKSYNNGFSWINLNKSLQTFQYYCLAGAAGNPDFVLAGAQDNGVLKHNMPEWMQVGTLADGAECVIDYSNPSIFYYSYQYGYINRYGYFDNVFRRPPPGGNQQLCAWITPYLMHPTDPKVLFFGAKDIYKTSDRGSSWTNYSTNLTASDGVGGGMLRSMAVSESNPDSILYAASYVVVYRTSDAGNSWHNITSNLPTSAGCFDCAALSSIAVHPLNPEVAWVTMSGYSPVNKVFRTNDGGKTWINISSNLPAIPVNSIVYEKNSKDALYIGTDLGVFYRDSTMDKWMPYMNELPNVPVQELEIHYGSGKLRAATFGRGLWETELYGFVSSVEEISDMNNGLLINSYPEEDYIELREKYCDYRRELEIFTVSGIRVFSGKAEKRTDISYLTRGLYFIRVGNKTGKFVKY